MHREDSYQPELLVARAELVLVFGTRPAALENGLAVLDPALGGDLPQVDLLAFVAAGDGVEVDLLQLRLALLFVAALGDGDRGVGARVEDVLAINGALAQSTPALGVAVFLAGRVDGRCGDVVLDVGEVGEDFGNASAAKVVDCQRWIPVSLGDRLYSMDREDRGRGQGKHLRPSIVSSCGEVDVVEEARCVWRRGQLLAVLCSRCC